MLDALTAGAGIDNRTGRPVRCAGNDKPHALGKDAGAIDDSEHLRDASRLKPAQRLLVPDGICWQPTRARRA